MTHEIPKCKACGHTPRRHDQTPQGVAYACSVVMTGELTHKRHVCLCRQFIPPDNWVYDPPANAYCKERTDPREGHSPRIDGAEHTPNGYSVVASCNWCKMGFVLRPVDKPKHDGAEYK